MKRNKILFQNLKVPDLGTIYLTFNWELVYLEMRVIAKSTLKVFYKDQSQYSDAKEPLDAWYQEAVQAKWANPMEIKEKYRSASILKNNRVVFNIAGNKYRLVVHINYKVGIIFIRFIGTHEQYNKIDPENV